MRSPAPRCAGAPPAGEAQREGSCPPGEPAERLQTEPRRPLARIPGVRERRRLLGLRRAGERQRAGASAPAGSGSARKKSERTRWSVPCAGYCGAGVRVFRSAPRVWAAAGGWLGPFCRENKGTEMCCSVLTLGACCSAWFNPNPRSNQAQPAHAQPVQEFGWLPSGGGTQVTKYI